MNKDLQAYSHRASGVDEEAQSRLLPGSLRDKGSILMLPLTRSMKRKDLFNTFDSGGCLRISYFEGKNADVGNAQDSLWANGLGAWVPF